MKLKKLLKIAYSKMKILWLKIRTSNNKSEEIWKLWEKFYTEWHIDKLWLHGKSIYAVYHNYELNQNWRFDIQYGNYDLLLGWESTLSWYDSIDIEKNDYKIFQVNGETGKEIFATWQEIWSSNIERSFKTDYELYSFWTEWKPNISVHIWINKKDS